MFGSSLKFKGSKHVSQNKTSILLAWIFFLKQYNSLSNSILGLISPIILQMGLRSCSWNVWLFRMTVQISEPNLVFTKFFELPCPCWYCHYMALYLYWKGATQHVYCFIFKIKQFVVWGSQKLAILLCEIIGNIGISHYRSWEDSLTTLVPAAPQKWTKCFSK